MSRKLIEIFEGQTFDTPPLWLMRQAGRYLPEYRELRARARSFLEFCYTPELAIEATLQPIRRFDFDAAIVFSDILVIPNALGLNVSFREGEGPIVETVRQDGDLDRLDDAGESVLEPVYDAVSGVRERLDADKALIGFAGAPWTVAVYMLEGRSGTDCAKAKTYSIERPEFVHRLLDIVTKATIGHLDRQIRAGADAVQIFDSWAGILDWAGFEAFVINPTRRIVQEIRARHPKVPIIGFPRGCGTGVEAYARETGVSGLQIDSGVSPQWAASSLSETIVIQGNLDNMALRQGGKAMDERVLMLLEAMKGRRFVFNLGHGVLPDTPLKNVERLVHLIGKK